MSSHSDERRVKDRSAGLTGSPTGAPVPAWDDWSSAPIGEEHRSLRVAASKIRAALVVLARDRGDPRPGQDLLHLLRAFRTHLCAHFEHEESACASSSACHQDGSPARQWLESLAVEHTELRTRIDEVLASLERCVAAHSVPPESFDAALVACLGHLAEHELSEARLFQIAVLGH